MIKCVNSYYCYFTAVFLLAFSVQINAQDQGLSSYKLGTDDVLSITVFDEPDLSIKEIRVSSSGTITMPLIGQLIISGLTISEVENKIYSLYLGDYLKKPDISVSILEYRQFYINGEVNKPGGYSYRDGMTVQRAIALAGGFTERASKRGLKILRENSNGIPIDAVMSTNIQPGDVLTVEESFF